MLVNGIFQRAGVTDSNGNLLRTITTLNTGLGTHDITVNLNGSSQGALFVVNTEGPFTGYPSYPNTSTINASGSTVPLIIFGGQGSSTITGGSGSDIIFAHRGEVTYDNSLNQPVTVLGNGGPGDSNNGFDLPPSLIATIDSTTGTTTILAGPSTTPTTPTPAGGAVYGAGSPNDSNIVFGEGPGAITGGTGNDIILGGYGSISLTRGQPLLIQTTSAASGGNEQITGGAGSDIIIGGPGANTIVGGYGNSVIAGSSAQVALSGGRLASVMTSNPGIGGNDKITGGPGNDIILGSAGADTIDGGSGNDLILGHDGQVTVSQGVPTFASSADPSVGLDDNIGGNTGNDVIVAGAGNNTISGGPGNDVILGHDGIVRLVGGVVTSAQSTDPTYAGNDSITTGNGTNLVMGGTGANSITAGPGIDIVLGANGTASLSGGIVTSAASIDPSNGGNNTIIGGRGTDVIIGGPGSNKISTFGTSDAAVGSDGSATFMKGQITSLMTTNPTVGGKDTINGGPGTEVIIGGPARV